MKIAIDGPSASGKSTIARLVAERFGFAYLDTGAMYRTVAAMALRHGVAVSDAEGILSLATDAPVFPSFSDEEIRTAEVSAVVSQVSSHPALRDLLVARQRLFAKDTDVVMDGRDIGTVVLPDADVKIYLDASAEVRARRRAAQSGRSEAEELAAVQKRDTLDKNKPVGALRVAEDAVLIDSSDLTVAQVVETISKIIDGKLKIEAK